MKFIPISFYITKMFQGKHDCLRIGPFYYDKCNGFVMKLPNFR